MKEDLEYPLLVAILIKRLTEAKVLKDDTLEIAAIDVANAAGAIFGIHRSYDPARDVVIYRVMPEPLPVQ
jgi:hypothetical protein